MCRPLLNIWLFASGRKIELDFFSKWQYTLSKEFSGWVWFNIGSKRGKAPSE